jgi:hypothetical protein
MATQKFEEKKDSFENVFSHRKVVFSSLKSAQKDQNMTILGYSCCLQSSLYFKSVDFLPKNDRYVCFRTVEFIKILSTKKVQAIKVTKILT